MARRHKGISLRLRLMLSAGLIALVFMLALMPALQSVFINALEESIEQRLAADASSIISAARIIDGELRMPDKLPDEEYNFLSARQLAFIYDKNENLLWQSSSSAQEKIAYRPQYDGNGQDFLRTFDENGREFFVYDVEIDVLHGIPAKLSIIAMQPVSDYKTMFRNLRRHLAIGLGGAWLLLLGFLWVGMAWGVSALRTLSAELDEIEQGSRAALSDDQPRELSRLTRSLNRLLEVERHQSERYKHSLDDLAHSLKTPLAVLQGVSETLTQQPENFEQAQTLQEQVNRMSQQVSYQLQRASLRKSGLVRHKVLLKPLVETLTDALNKVYRDKKVHFETDFANDLCVSMEQGALLELMGNLLENAYRLSLGYIRVSATVQNKWCEIIVEDDGPGVPADQRERILKRGERLDTQFPGQGIGTAVVVDIVDSYGGSLLLQDSQLGGAKFIINLPCY